MNINEPTNMQKAVVKSYRKKMNLCLLCGMDYEGHPNGIECKENYIKSDMRGAEKLLNKTDVSITINNESAGIEKPIKSKNIQKSKRTDGPIIIDITKSKTGYGMSYEFIEFIKRKYNKITYVIGDILQYPPFLKVVMERNRLSLNYIYKYNNEKDQEELKKLILSSCVVYCLDNSKFLDFMNEHDINIKILETDGKDIDLEIVRQNPNQF